MFLLLNLMHNIGTLAHVLSAFCILVCLQFSISFPTLQHSKPGQAQQNTL